MNRPINPHKTLDLKSKSIHEELEAVFPVPELFKVCHQLASDGGKYKEMKAEHAFELLMPALKVFLK